MVSQAVLGSKETLPRVRECSPMVQITEPVQITIIRQRRGWAGIGLRELVGYHELAYFLVLRDLKVRYKQTVFGIAWAVLQPLLLMLILSLFLGQTTGIR